MFVWVCVRVFVSVCKLSFKLRMMYTTYISSFLRFSSTELHGCMCFYEHGVAVAHCLCVSLFVCLCACVRKVAIVFPSAPTGF